MIFIASSLSAFACAVIAGVFLAFSDFVMRSLDRTSDGSGIEAMQIINREVLRTIFMVLLIGMAITAPVLALFAYHTQPGPPAMAIIIASAIYTFGVFGVTLGFNVPKNQRLDKLTVPGATAENYWKQEFYPNWTVWNHVRTAASALAAIGFFIGAILTTPFTPLI